MGMVLYEEQTVARGFSNVIILNLGKLRYRVDLGSLPLVLGNGNWGGEPGSPPREPGPGPALLMLKVWALGCPSGVSVSAGGKCRC